ncbi:MAG: hypothetical protein WA213_21645 [Terriglobales bacterium]
MRGRNSKGTFVKKQPILPTLEERMERLGVSYYEFAVLKLVISDGFSPRIATKVVEKKLGVKVDVNALYRKLNP